MRTSSMSSAVAETSGVLVFPELTGIAALFSFRIANHSKSMHILAGVGGVSTAG